MEYQPGVFIGDSVLAMFEYNLQDRSIDCDGNYRPEEKYSKRTPFIEWRLEIYYSASPQG